jgi:hypothetical protein
MRNGNFSGLGTNNLPQDAAMVQSPGPIQDREEEHLGTTDKAIIANRRVFLKAIRQVEAGGDAPHVIRDVAKARVPEIAVISEIVSGSEDWRNYWQKCSRIDDEKYSTAHH